MHREQAEAMGSDLFQGFLGFVSLLSAIVSIVMAAHAARHDRSLRAWLLSSAFGASMFCLGVVVERWDTRELRAQLATYEEAMRAARERANTVAARRPADAANRAAAPAAEGPVTPAQEACAINDTWECAEKLTLGQIDRDEFRASDQERYYYVDVTEPSAFTVTVDPVPQRKQIQLTVHDAFRREINERWFIVQTPGSLDTRVRTVGRYYIKLRLSSCCPQTPEPYAITLAS